MTSLTVGNIVENSAQRARVRWMGLIQKTPIIGLQLIDSTLPGYTDGICTLDNNRYFTCPDGQGYYVLESSFHDFYNILQSDIRNNKTNGSNDEFNASESTSNERTDELATENRFAHENNDNNDHCPLFGIANTHEPSAASTNLPIFGHEYFLNGWTLRRIKSFVHKEVSILQQLCLNIFSNECDVQSVIDEQIHGCSPKIPSEPPKDISIELIRLFENVKIIFPTRAIRLYNCDYLLLAILCSNNQCAYVRTSTGWAYTDDDSEDGHPFVVDEISDMIDDPDNNAYKNSEQCLHLLQNASYLYYKLVE